MLTIVVTGSRGFIGTNIVKKLSDLGHKIIEIDSKLGHDITDLNAFSEVNNFDVLIHLAARSYIPYSYENPQDFYFINMNSTLNSLEICRKKGAKMIYISSYVYGNPEYLPIDEKHPIKAFNPYAQTKLIGEKICEGYFRDFDVPITIVRPFNIFGKGQSENFLISKIVHQALKGKILLQDPEPKRDMLYIDDFIDVLSKLAIRKSLEYEIFNIGSGKSVSVLEMANFIKLKANNGCSLDFTGEKRINEVLDTCADISKVNQAIGWKPKYSFYQGIDLMFENL